MARQFANGRDALDAFEAARLVRHRDWFRCFRPVRVSTFHLRAKAARLFDAATGRLRYSGGDVFKYVYRGQKQFKKVSEMVRALDLSQVRGALQRGHRGRPAGALVFPPRLTGVVHRGRVELNEPDVLSLVPPTEDILHLDRVWKLHEHASPLVMLELWRPATTTSTCPRPRTTEAACGSYARSTRSRQ